MELVLVLVVVVAVGALIYFNRSARSLDMNQNGLIDAVDALAAVETAKEGVKATVKKATARAKTATKPAAKKSAAKKSSPRPKSKTAK